MIEGDEEETFLSILGAVLCILGAAFAAGLTLGLLGFDSFHLNIVIESDPKDCKDDKEKIRFIEEQKHARIILPLIEDHHRLLVTLLIMNSLCAEALPIFLGNLVPSYVAVLLSVSFVLFFGEILPSAVFSGPKGMRASADLAPLIRILLFILAPIAVPIGRFLDWWIGEEEDESFTRPELRALLRLHAGGGLNAVGKQLTYEQCVMMEGAMDLITTKAEEVMTPVDDMFMISSSAILDLSLCAEIVGKGYSRIPVFENNNKNRVKGVLLTKTLVVINPHDNRDVSSLGLRVPACVSTNASLYEVLEKMKTTKSHLCLVSDNPKQLGSNMISGTFKGNPKLFGCISLHDIFSTLFEEELESEFTKRRGRKHSDYEEDESGTDEEEAQNIQDVLAPLRPKLLKWANRAKTTTKLNQMLNKRTEKTPLLFPSTSAGASAAPKTKEQYLARKMTAEWLMRRTSFPDMKKELRKVNTLTAKKTSSRKDMKDYGDDV